MRKSRFIFAAVVAAAVLAPAAHADGQASPGVYQGWNGLVDQAHGVRFVALPADRGRWTVLARIKLRGGSVTRYGSILGSYGIPGVTFRGDVGGLSPDGRLLVVAATAAGGLLLRPVSHFAVVDAKTLRTRARVTLAGDLSFDALSPDGRTLYLIQHTSTRDLQRYRVRAYDLVRRRLLPDAIVDRTEPNMRGYPLARISGPGGAWVYTLYQGDETFVHALDTVHGRAVCLDLPWHGNQNLLWSARLRLDGSKLLVVGKDGKRIAGLELAPRRTSGLGASWWSGIAGLAIALPALVFWRRRGWRRLRLGWHAIQKPWSSTKPNGVRTPTRSGSG
jgi:hypothetical protein